MDCHWRACINVRYDWAADRSRFLPTNLVDDYKERSVDDKEKKELEVYREAFKKFGGCGVAVPLAQGWITRLLKDEVAERLKDAGVNK